MYVHGRITGDLRRACVFIKIHKYIASSPVRNLNNLLRVVVERGFSLLFVQISQVSISKRDAFNLPYNFVTYSFVWDSRRRIVCARNSQMASSLSQIRVLCSTLTIKRFSREIEKNIHAMKLSRFLKYRRIRNRRNPQWLPGVSFAQISPLLWSFSCFWQFHRDRGIE